MTLPAAKKKPRVLFVDDEHRVLDGISLNLRKEYEVHVATSGDRALARLAAVPDIAVVVSDFRMPEMDGATFLQEVISVAPTVTRILLTGEAGVDGARNAVNKGQIFRYLSKPCPPDELKVALEEGIAYHRFLCAERTVMQETLLECIAALMEVLAVTNPVAFGRAKRLKELVGEIANRVGLGKAWQLEAAAMLSQLGFFPESPVLAEKIYYGRQLTVAEEQRAAVVPKNAMRLLEHIPRLEPVMQILDAMEWPDDEVTRVGDRMVGLGSRILSVALLYDTWNTQRVPREEILPRLRAQEARYGRRLLDTVEAMIRSAPPSEADVVEIPLRDAKPGMRLREEIRNTLGALLVPVNMVLSVRLIDRLSQVAPETLDKVVKLEKARAA